MEVRITFLIIIGFLWMIQSILTYFQIRDYQKISIELANQGKLIIGAKRGYLSKGTIIAMTIDNNYNIIDCRLLNGISVLARFRKFEILIGKNLFDEDNKNLLNKSARHAYEKALISMSSDK